jgi:glyoxylase-like metal-dependent hydrolase (beta-lactamase superfamily II)
MVGYRWPVAALLLIGLVAWSFSERRSLFIHALAFTGSGEPPPLLERLDEGAAVTWIDNYFTIEQIAEGTWAIGEPRYAQQNYSYLIAGNKRAILFDAGPGLRDIKSAAESLTELPIIFLPSHFHYDHVGNRISFAETAVVDLPYLRKRARGNRLTLTAMEHLGRAEGFEIPSWRVDHWWAPGTSIDLGGRAVQLFYTPGHTTDSISLFDAGGLLLFSGDYLYPGPLYGFLPNSSMADYLSAAERLLGALPEGVIFYGAHRLAPPGPPKLQLSDLRDLRTGLEGIKAGLIPGGGGYPATFVISERLDMLAEPRWLQRWN